MSMERVNDDLDLDEELAGHVELRGGTCSQLGKARLFLVRVTEEDKG